jgi:curli biogenesis system outer membrane secretion channel CsgG
MISPIQRLAATALLAAAVAVSGCASAEKRQSDTYSVGLFRSTPRLKPVVAVMDFENRAGFTGQWNLGSGMADLLNAELLESSRIVVLERQHLGDVLNELNLQGGDLFRPEGRAARGRLKNAQYLIRGVVTDFTVTDDTSGWFSTDSVSLRAGSSRARVAIAVRVYDVENGQVITTVKADADASAGGFGGSVKYQEISFGADSYFRTPLGRATERAIGKAVKKLLVDLPARPWEPRVAEVDGGTAFLNGGSTTGFQPGQVYLVREAGRTITDPDTGNVLDTLPGDILGKLVVETVTDTAAQARIVEGTARRGDFLERITP